MKMEKRKRTRLHAEVEARGKVFCSVWRGWERGFREENGRSAGILQRLTREVGYSTLCG